MKKALLKRTADVLEKLAVGCMLVGLFKANASGIWLGVSCMALSYGFTMLGEKP